MSKCIAGQYNVSCASVILPSGLKYCPFIECGFEDGRVVLPIPPLTEPHAAKILHTAANLVAGPRAQSHGPAGPSFEFIGNLWGIYLEGAHQTRVEINAVDVAWMMTLLKIARSVQGEFVEDHAVDACGYSALAGEIALAGKKV